MAEWLAQGPFTLTLSAGFFGFFAHSGFLAALEEVGLLPAAVSGSSAGALVGGIWASGCDAADMTSALLTLQRQDFWDPAWGAGLLRGRMFEQKLSETLHSQRFEACRTPLSVSVYDLKSRKTEVFTSGDLVPAIRASCTFPGLFHPAQIAGRTYIDGGVADRSGLHGVPHGERVLYHHLSSRSTIRKHFKKLSWYPRRAGMLPVITQNLPRVGPFKLHRGQQAFETARDAVREALGRPIPDRGGQPHLIPT